MNLSVNNILIILIINQVTVSNQQFCRLIEYHCGVLQIKLFYLITFLPIVFLLRPLSMDCPSILIENNINSNTRFFKSSTRLIE